MGRIVGLTIAGERRRTLIASLLVRNPRITRRQLHEMLARPMSQGGLRNPDTGEPYSLGTIQNDVDEIRAEWERKRLQSTSEWVARELAVYEELEMQAWRDGDLAEVRRVSEARRKLLGLDAPSKQQITGADDGPIVITWPEH